ncbi:MAG: hypothetical protein ACQEXJ_16060 [Myxococcota bacterium]
MRFPRMLVVWLAVAASIAATDARAETCGQVDPDGQCVDGRTLVWCADGELKTATCPPGELCTQHDAFDGGYGCVAIEATDCADIPREGRCTAANHVVWCDGEGRVRTADCGEDAVCGWDDGLEAYDCLPMTTAHAEEADAAQDSDAGPPSDAGVPSAGDAGPARGADAGPVPDAGFAPDAGPSSVAAGPTPSVERGGVAGSPAGAPPAEDGCAATRGAPVWGAVLLLLALAVRRRISG